MHKNLHKDILIDYRSAVYNKRIRQKFFKNPLLRNNSIQYQVQWYQRSLSTIQKNDHDLCIFKWSAKGQVSVVSQLVSFYLKNCIEKNMSWYFKPLVNMCW